MPTQLELIHQLGLSNNSISAAMERLIKEGVLKRVQKKGTVILDPKKGEAFDLWRIGLLMPKNYQQSLFISFVMHQISVELQKFCCTPIFYNNNNDNIFPQLKHYSGLLTDIKEKKIDGIISTALYDREFPIPTVTITELGTCSYVNLDFLTFCMDALTLISEKSIENIGVLLINNSHYKHIFSLAHSLLKEHLKKNQTLYFFEINTENMGHFESGQYAAKQFLANPPAKKPDCWVMFEDVSSSGFIDILAKNNNYHPEYIVATNKEAPIYFSAPVYRFEFSLTDLARELVHLITELITSNDHFYRFKSIKPKLLSKQARQ